MRGLAFNVQKDFKNWAQKGYSKKYEHFTTKIIHVQVITSCMLQDFDDVDNESVD